MTLEEVQNWFGTSEGYFYRSNRNKTDMEILLDIDQTAYTLSNAQGLFVRTLNEITHPEYTRIE